MQVEADKTLHDKGIRLSTLRQELDERQKQWAQATEQNAELGETMNNPFGSLEESQARICELEPRKKGYQTAVDKLMGNLTLW